MNGASWCQVEVREARVGQGVAEQPERSDAVGDVVQNDGKCAAQLLTVRVVRPVVGGNFSEQNYEERPNRQLTAFQCGKSAGQDWVDVGGCQSPGIETAAVLQGCDSF